MCTWDKENLYNSKTVTFEHMILRYHLLHIQRPDFELNRTLTLRSHATMELSIEQVTRLLSEGDLATPVMESRCSV